MSNMTLKVKLNVDTEDKEVLKQNCGAKCCKMKK